MNKMALAAGVLLCALGGCAHEKVPFQATWYMVEDGMYLAVLNQSTQKQEIRSVILNPANDTRGTGWKLSEDLPPPLEPGQILLRPFEKFKDGGGNPFGKCRLPVDVLIVTSAKDVRADMKVGMPSAVPLGWNECPHAK